ncbi:tRNA (guanosine(46)-N7)-methyltransferase TrmB [Halalkalibacillus halophilus]|uniref:tRNA (guanosine(46)-N7)-methyltransferase TrmB n=1 Tax=Halalkalibacillus halophilus TaxID=392827 RepID=UPI0004278B45|nr:tRNA (guanosine(46)-N7)-methyltransferase TrmB [Halalkalibacillus halophilus]
MRLRNKPWADDYIKENDHVVEQRPFEQIGKWKTVFNNNQPLALEIGTGKGQFIKGMALQHPEVNFIGMERDKNVIVSAIEHLKDNNIRNARLIHQKAEDLRDLFAENEVDTLYLNFSDPWPKTRHAKRRLTFPSFLEQYQAVLKEEGEVILKSDNRKFFEYSIESFSAFGMLLKEVSVDLHNDEDEKNVMTEYEEKFASKGQPIYRCVAKFQK